MPNRFVILHHTGYGNEHWDFMVEHDDVLWTWQLCCDPRDPDNFPMPAKRIGNHRKVYLHYEGPVSAGRGHVRRVDGGEYDLLALDELGVRLGLRGGMLRGTYRLSFAEAPDCWELGPIENSPA